MANGDRNGITRREIDEIKREYREDAKRSVEDRAELWRQMNTMAREQGVLNTMIEERAKDIQELIAEVRWMRRGVVGVLIALLGVIATVAGQT